MKTKIKNADWRLLLRALVLAATPWLWGILRCATDGKTLTDIYLPTSPWNDELFYYKLTECVSKYGFPHGYFGFNEKHGQLLSFAAWSPVLLLFFVLYALLFGWNLLSPIFCNLLIMSLAMFGFGLITKVGRAQTAAAIIAYGLFMPVTRFTLSVMPEATFYGLLLIYAALVFRGTMTKVSLGGVQKIAAGRSVIIALFVITALLTLMRPYFLLLFWAPVSFLKKRSGWGKALGIGIIPVALTMIAYYLINHFFSAPYLVDLFYTDGIEALKTQGLLGGIAYNLHKFKASSYTILLWCREALIGKNGHMEGAHYLTYLVCCVIWVLVFAVSAVRMIAERKSYKTSENGRRDLLPGFQMSLVMGGFFAADMLMYRLAEGSRHTLPFIFVSVLFFGYMAFREVRLQGRMLPYVGLSLLAVLLVFEFWLRADFPYEYGMHYGEEARVLEVETFGKQCRQNMKLEEDKPVPNYENTVIWTFRDTVNGEKTLVDYGPLYELPAGFGINLCDEAYLSEHFGNLQSRYIAVAADGELSGKCEEKGYRLVAECSTVKLYDSKIK